MAHNPVAVEVTVGGNGLRQRLFFSNLRAFKQLETIVLQFRKC